MEDLELRLFNLKNVCRLCSTKVDLVSIFHKKFDFPQKMEAIVLTLTTVTVTKQDEISQNICSRCVAVVIKMFQFRDQAIRNDQLLKAQYELLKKTINKSNEKDNADNIQKNGPMKRKSNLTVDTKEEKTESKLKVSQRTKPNYKIHSSVASLFRRYPNIRVPTNCLGSNMQPTVVMEMDAVENYFKSKKLNMYKYVQLALNQPRKVAFKHTLSSNQLYMKNLITSDNKELGQRTKRKFSGDDSSSEQTVKKQSVCEDVPDLSVASSHMLHICSVCSSVHSRAMHLKRHMTKHLHCQFCKSKFKNLETKQKHVESECKIQKIMKSMIHLPEIPLQKIELDANVTRKFYKTFDAFGLISKIEERIPTTINKNTPINIDITIKNCSGLNSLLLNKSTDIKIIKNLLVQYNKQHRKINNASQTFLPTNELIKVNHNDLTVELKSLKQHLFYYKIPIDVKNGSTVNVCYKYDSSNKNKRELKHWNHLTPIDVHFRSGKNILKRFDPILADKEIKQELINMEHAEMEEIPIEDIYNLSLPNLTGSQVNRLHHSNTEVSSTSDNQQVYAGTDSASKNQTSEENVVTIQDENLSSTTNRDVTFIQDVTFQKNVAIRVKTVCEINK